MSIDFYKWSGLLALITNIGAALFVYLHDRKNSTNRIFALFSSCIGFWAVGSWLVNIVPDKKLAINILRVNYSFGVFVPILFVELVSSLSGIRKKSVCAIGYLLSFIFLVSILTPLFIKDLKVIDGFGFYITQPGKLYYFFIIYFCTYFIIAFRIISQGLRCANESKTMQLKYVFLAYLVGLFAGIEYFISVLGILKRPPIDDYILVITFLILTYAILKHGLLDIKIVIKRAFFYSLLALTLSFLYILAIFLTNKILVDHSALESHNTLSHFNPFVISSFLVALSSIFVGFFVYLKDPRRKLCRLFLFFNLVVAVWGIGGMAIGLSHNPNTSLWLWRTTYALGVMWIPVFFLHFAYEFCETKKTFLLRLIYIFHLLLLPFIFSSSFYSGTRFVFNSFYYGSNSSIIPFVALFLIWAIIFTYGHFLIFKALRSTKEIKMKHHAFMLLLAVAIPAVGGSLNFLPFFRIDIYPWGNFTILLTPIIMAFAILKFQLFDIRLIIKKTLKYSVFVFLISLIYLAAVYIFYKVFLSANVSRPSLNFGAFSVLVIAILFKPLELLLHRLLERHFFKGTISEISEQKERLETELERRERLKSVGILAAGMAHEIKNPLTSIKTFAEYLPKKYDDPEFREKFSRIVVDEVDRVNNIVKQLLEFSKPSSPDLKPILISELLEQTVSLLNSNLLRYKIELIKNYDAYAMILADWNQLKQAFLNIFINSIQSMPDGGTLSITARTEPDGQVKIVVSDTGCGISAEQLTHVFDPFYTTKEDGTGLGLAIVHGIITKHGGKIQMESVVGKGTTVNVTLKSQS